MSKNPFSGPPDGPEVSFGKHSQYYLQGKDKIVITTKISDEEWPPNFNILKNTKHVIFQGSNGKIKSRYQLDQTPSGTSVGDIFRRRDDSYMKTPDLMVDVNELNKFRIHPYKAIWTYVAPNITVRSVAVE